MENLRFTKTDFSWCGLVIVEVSSVEKEKKNILIFGEKFMTSFQNVKLQFLWKKKEIRAKTSEAFFQATYLEKNREIVGSEFIDTIILRHSCDLTRKIVCARELKSTETEVNNLRGHFSFTAKVHKKIVKPSGVKNISKSLIKI